MKNLFRSTLGAVAIAGLFASAALAQTSPANNQPTAPQVQSINPGDLFQDVPNGFPSAQSQYAPASLLGNYSASLAGNNPTNDLIGGDFSSNLFQDGTSVGSITTSATYVADQWAAFSGTSTTLTGAQETAAADIPAGFNASLRITRSGAGILQSCVAQIIPYDNVIRYQGQTAEFDFHALAGSGFSSASSQLQVLVVTGTGTNDTMANLAKTVNSALSGTAWAGAATLTVNVPISTVWTRYSAAFPIPAAATELGVLLCWTPVGTSPSNDYFEFTGAQLTPNSALSAVAGTAGAALNPNDTRAKSFFRRPQMVEANLQYAFYWRQNESTANIYGVCQETSSTNAFCFMNFPVPMFTTPTLSFTAGGISMTLGTSQAAVAVTGLVIKANGATVTGAQLTATAASGLTALTGFLEGTTTTGKVAFSARF
jgi:hypothetical protein